MKTNNAEKIVSLQKYVEKIKNQMTYPSSKYKDGYLTSYLEWCQREIKRTESKISILKV